MKGGLNDPCPCGSGRKYTQCCGRLASVPASSPAGLDAPAAATVAELVELVGRGHLSEAEQRTRTLLGGHPDAAILWKILSVCLMRQDKDALEPLRRTVALMPQDLEAHRNLGQFLCDQGLSAEGFVSLRRALELGAADAASFLEAGDAARASGDLESAVGLYRQALQRNAQSAAAHDHLGSALRQLGQLEDALASTRRALELDPNLSVAHHNLGLVLTDLGRRAEAVASYRRALELDPRYVEALNNLALLLPELRQRREALALFQRAIEIEPRNSAARAGLGATLRMMGQPEAAEASCLAAIEIDPDCVAARALLGELRADRGQFAAAEEQFQRVLQIDPKHPFAYFSIATNRRMTHEETAWLAGIESLLAGPLTRRHEISLRYALGKYHDDTGQYEQAWHNYELANKLTREHGAPYDRQGFEAHVSRILQTFDARALPALQPLGDPSERPLFIIGMPRSGTSLCEQILASHPAVFGAGELPFWQDALTAYESAGAGPGVAAELIPGMARDFLHELAAHSATAARVIDKMPQNFLAAGLIHAAFPRARIIHLRRHPIDTCLSIYSHYFSHLHPFAHVLDDLAHYYGQYLRLTAHWRAVLPPTAYLEVPYESLVAEQEAWSRRMVEFIGLPWDPKCLDFHETDRTVITLSKWQVRQKMHSASAGRWRHYEHHVGPLLPLIELADRLPAA